MNNSELAHRWVHGMLNSNGELNGNNMYGNILNLYSYSTVIAQCIDRIRSVFIVIDENLTPTTSKHRSHLIGALHDGCTVIYTHFPYSNGYDDVELLSHGQAFDKNKRLMLVEHLLGNLYSEYKCVVNGNSLDTEKIDKRGLESIFKLDYIYGETLLAEWLRVPLKSKFLYEHEKRKAVRKMVRMIIDKRTDAEITDELFGAGTWDAMQKRIAPLKKAQKTRLIKKKLEYDRRMESINRYRNMSDAEIRQAWRNHDSKIPYECLQRAICDTGGNVILRLSRNGEKIETSKGISMDINEAIRCWKIIKLWHDDGIEMVNPPYRFAGYSVNSYKNNVLVAGCHTIFYQEIERMYSELRLKGKAA